VIFGDVPLDRAAGAILAHSVRLPEGRLRKGVVLGDAEVARLRDAGIDHVTVARLTGTDMDENEAATRIGSALLADGLELRPAFTGRANLHATQAGVFEVSRQRIDALNLCDPDITVATLPEWQRVAAGMMVATVKIIPYAADFAVFGPHLDAARGALRLHPPAIDRAELIVTKLTGAPTGVKAVLSRLDRLGVAHSVTEVAHEIGALSQALAAGNAPLRLILTASATSDVRDVGPAALVAAGGRLTRFGMPVDPGNLLFLGDLKDARVIGLPGCARSPALNGADWVLERVICGVPVTSGDIAGMGVGGLLNEIPTRPQPRDRANR